MIGWLYVLWIATIGADRIDLLAGSGPLILKPFLVLGPLVVVLESARVFRRGGYVQVGASATAFLLVQTALLSTLLLSVAWSYDTSLALGRLVLMTVEAYICFAVLVLLANRGDAATILTRGAFAGLALFTAFDIVQIAGFLGSVPVALGLGGVIDIQPATYGGLLPRPSGSSVDPNRGGFVALTYGVLLLMFARGTRVRTAVLGIAWALLIITLSRSAILAGLATMAGWIVWRGATLPRWAVAAVASAGIATGFVLFFSGAAREATVALLEVLAGRVSVSEGSSSDHLTLIGRGWEVATADLRTLLLGIGYGNSYIVLQEFFSGDKYGNFHSMYITFLVEAGVVALTLVGILLLVPLARGSGFRPLVLGVVFFSMFYQVHAEAIFWMVLGLAWLLPEPRVIGGTKANPVTDLDASEGALPVMIG